MKAGRTLVRLGVFIVYALACARPDRAAMHDTTRTSNATAAQSPFCQTPAGGIVVRPDTVAGLPTHDPITALVRRCSAGDTTLYDFTTAQAMARMFPFRGAQVFAIQTNPKGRPPQPDVELYMVDSEPADLWIAQGDSVRLPDGALLPRTVGALRQRYERYGRIFLPLGDEPWPTALVCRFPYLDFIVAWQTSHAVVRDSAGIVGVELGLPARQTHPLCAATRSGPVAPVGHKGVAARSAAPRGAR